MLSCNARGRLAVRKLVSAADSSSVSRAGSSPECCGAEPQGGKIAGNVGGVERQGQPGRAGRAGLQVFRLRRVQGQPRARCCCSEYCTNAVLAAS